MSMDEIEKKFQDIKVEVETTVDPHWVSMVVHDPDLFMTDHVGYWLRRVDKSGDPTLGQLGWEFEEDPRTTNIRFVDRMSDEDETKLHEEAVRAWKDHLPLPPYYFAMNIETAKKSWAAGVKKHGFEWYETGDANTYDYVIQMALLGECKYG